MQVFENIAELNNALDGIQEEDWVYTDINVWNKTPQKARFHFVTFEEIEEMDDEDVYIDEDDQPFPLSLKDKHLRGWMLISTLRSVIVNLRKKHPNYSMDELIHAINHYREYDDFYE